MLLRPVSPRTSALAVFCYLPCLSHSAQRVHESHLLWLVAFDSRQRRVATMIARHLARDTARLIQFLLCRNSMCRGRSCSLEVVVDTITSSASYP